MDPLPEMRIPMRAILIFRRKHGKLKDTYDIEQALDEADLLAENSNERMTHEEVFHALKSRVTIPFTLHGIEEMLTVEYKQGTDPREIGYDALQGFPIDKICCIGYPVMHGYFEHMNATGYRRSCGFIQFVERIENYGENRELSIDVSDDNLEKGIHILRMVIRQKYLMLPVVIWLGVDI